MRLALMIAALAATPLMASAQQPDAGRDLAASCAMCHGTDGRSAHPGFKALAGMERSALATELRNFRDGKRPATVMHQIAKGYTDAEIDLIAAYFAAQKR
ncbi:MAG: c-type cytochrome [Sutterellaceae bacterium]|nr:c-type cytochrome [Burkholderiaceae bacterium]MCX7901455.1 c-type cytochrome [Burkholderiaceae bacterium]MDW8430500.1 c-type cytochrome [Sutterellaceae bacterium]